jgi:hypothetical protein
LVSLSDRNHAEIARTGQGDEQGRMGVDQILAAES